MYLVGGAVRDFFLAYPEGAHFPISPEESRTDSDPLEAAWLDMATLAAFLDSGFPERPVECDFVVCGIPLDELAASLGNLGKADFVGKSFGVLKFSPDSDCEFLGWRLKGGRRYDLALPRVEKSTGSHHRDFEVSYDPFIPIGRDLLRRDFTINAMAAAPDGALIDPSGGRKDLRDRRLCTVFEKSFEEDPLRILRGAQFAARFKLEFDPGLIESAKPVSLEGISPERVREELIKGITLPEKPSPFFRHLADMHKLSEAFPEVSAIADFEDFCRRLDSCDADLRLDILFRFAGGRGKNLFERLKFSNGEIRRATVLRELAGEFTQVTAEFLTQSKLRCALKKASKLPGCENGAEGIETFLRFAKAAFGTEFDWLEMPMRAEIPAALEFTENPPVTGERLLEMGFAEGRQIGEILRAVSEAHDRGEIETAADAERWVMERYGGGG